jgi:hypothetical protein
MAASGALPLEPIARKPGGRPVRLSPWLLALLEGGEDAAVLGHGQLGWAVLALAARLDLAAELQRHQLLAVADAQHRHA